MALLELRALAVSEATRQRYLFLKNRLEELLTFHGPPEVPEQCSIECDPTWGPVGSLARKWMDEAAIDVLLAMDRDMAQRGLAQAAQSTPAIEALQPVVEEQPPQKRVPLAAKRPVARGDGPRKRPRGADW